MSDQQMRNGAMVVAMLFCLVLLLMLCVWCDHMDARMEKLESRVTSLEARQ